MERAERTVVYVIRQVILNSSEDALKLHVTSL